MMRSTSAPTASFDARSSSSSSSSSLALTSSSAPSPRARVTAPPCSQPPARGVSSTRAMSSSAPASARELFGAYADVREITSEGIERSSSTNDDASASRSRLWESRERRAFGPCTRWDSDDLGRALVVNVFDGLKTVDVEALARVALDEREHGRGIARQ